MVKQITLSIAADGSVTAKSHGRQGKKCVDDLALITGLVGDATVVSSRLTDEYELPEVNNQFETQQEWVQE